MSEKLDNTRVARKLPLSFKLSKELKLNLMNKAASNKAVIYDAKKAKYYQNMLNFYNSNFFGHQTNYNPVTDLEKIQASFDYSKDNIKNFYTNLLTTGILSSFKGLLPFVSKRATVDKLSSLEPYKIGEGAEAIVINNSPTTVGKITQVGSGEMLKRNAIPNSLPLKFVGYVRDGSKRFPTFILKKVKVLTEETFPKYVDKLDKAMKKSGFTKVDNPNVQYRAYTNGSVVVDDVSPDNVGLTLFGNPKLIDFNVFPLETWLNTF